MKNDDVRIGIADLNIALPPKKLITVGLGSCIGIALYDSRYKIGGLSHIMLPDSTEFTHVNNPMKFADLAIPLLLEKMAKEGVLTRNLKAKICGGASMFNFSDKSMIMNIGKRNSAAVKKVLGDLGIPIIAEDIGGNKGRTMIFDTSNGVVQIKTVGMAIKEM